MARTKAGESMRGYWRRIMLENSQLLDGTDNEPLRDIWKKNHGGKDLNKQWEASLTTTKSDVRRELGKRRRRGRGRRKNDEAVPAERKLNPVNTMLAQLELAVDDWIYNLRQARSTKVSAVIDALRHVRPELYRALGS
jgi:hypothetical protein